MGFKISNIPKIDLPPIAHYLGGILVPVLVLFNLAILGVLIFLAFMIYEIIEFIALHDKAWKDIREFVEGLVLGSIFDIVMVVFF